MTPVVRTDNAERFTLSVAYPAGRANVSAGEDGFRDFASAQAIERAAHDYLLKSCQVGLLHEEGTEGAGQVVESYIYRGPDWDTGTGHVVKEGDWLLGIVWSEETWPLVVAGQIGGLSVEGTARRRAVPHEVAEMQP